MLEELRMHAGNGVLNRLTLVFGPPNSGKMGHLLEWWRERIQARPVLVAPTYLAALDLSEEMVRSAGALVGVSPALTFDGLMEAIVKRPLSCVGGTERLLMGAHLLSFERLEVLEPVAEFSGTLRGLAAFLAELDDSGRGQEGVKLALARWGANDPGSARLAEELGRLYEAYVRCRQSLNLLSRGEALREAVGSVREWERPVGFYGFTSFTPAQRSLITALASRVEVMVVLPHDESSEVSQCPPGEVTWWRQRAGRLVEKSRGDHAYASPALAYLERYFASRCLPSEDPPASSPVEGVTFLLCAGRRAELEATAERIAHLVNQGFPLSDIAVLVRSMREWRALIRQVFGACGIPYELDEQLALRETGLGHSLLAALRGVFRDETGALLAFLRSPYSGEDQDRVCELERCYLSRHLRGAQALIDLAEEIGLGSLEVLHQLPDTDRQQGCDGLGGMYLNPHKARLLARGMLVHGASKAQAEPEQDEDFRAYLALGRTFRLLETLPREFRRLQLILRILPDLPVPGRRPQRSEAVQVMTMSRARGRRFAIVFLLGMVEGEFPRKSDSPSLLSSSQRSLLDRSAGGGLLSEEEEREEALFLTGVSRAWQLLVLSAREAEEDGSKTEVSRFWTEARLLLGVDKSGLGRRSLADQVFTPDKAPCPREYVRACLARGLSPNPAVGPLAAAYPGLSVLTWSRPPSRLTSPAALAEFRNLESFSPSALEAFSRCPFAWFLERVVGVEEFGGELDNRVVGELLHRVLSDVYRRLFGCGLLPLRLEGLSAAKNIADRAIGALLELKDEAITGTPGEWRLLLARIRVLVHGLFELEAARGCSLQLRATEKWIGGREGVDIGGLRIRGRIDRVDALEDGDALFVLDYKSGRVPPAAQLATQDDLQLALYLLALRAAYPECEVIGGAYVSPAERAYSGVVRADWREAVGTRAAGLRVLNDGEWAELLEAARDLAAGAAEGIRSGVIAPRAQKHCPEWCDLGAVCRSERKERRR